MCEPSVPAFVVAPSCEEGYVPIGAALVTPRAHRFRTQIPPQLGMHAFSASITERLKMDIELDRRALDLLCVCADSE